MKEHLNFYECLKEANDRLRGTIVMYNDMPFYVLAITDHKGDGVFRIYLDPIGIDPSERHSPNLGDYSPGSPNLGVFMDDWIEKFPKSGILRKQMNSPHFNKYRPFPLGMCNYTTIGFNNKIQWSGTYYLERQPARPSMSQGLTRNMICEHLVSASPRRDNPKDRLGTQIDVMSPAFLSCVKADHPSAKECLENLLDPDIENEAVAFHRDFALIRGPIDMIFLGYKADVIGVLPKNNFEYLRIGRKFRQCKEVVEELGLFANVQN